MIDGARDNVIQGNYIGVNAAGTDIIFQPTGIDVTNATNNLIGGTAFGAGNVISGNGTGVSLSAGAVNTRVQGNSGPCRRGQGPDRDAAGRRGRPVAGLAGPHVLACGACQRRRSRSRRAGSRAAPALGPNGIPDRCPRNGGTPPPGVRWRFGPVPGGGPEPNRVAGVPGPGLRGSSEFAIDAGPIKRA
jgi:hypothetical protein